MNKEKHALKNQRRLSIARPDLVTEWHPTKNVEHHPTLLTIGSGKKVWWQCEKGHEWEATVKNRAKGSQCPVCQLQRRKTNPYPKRCQPENFLSNRHPELLKWWHPTKNEGLDSSTITIKSNFKIWWQCEKGHTWQRRILEQINSQCCPYCVGRLPIAGETDFLTTHPHLAREWHPTKNESLTPDQFTFGSARLVWWQCAHGHEWQGKIFARSNGMNCPICHKKQTLHDNALGIKYPELIREWHPTKNEGLTPFDVTYGSGKRIWWQCEQGHEWENTVNSRTISHTKCPYCRIIKHNHTSDAFGKSRPSLTKE